MIGLGSIFSLASGGLTFLQGADIKKSAKKSADIKNKIVEQRNYYNQKELNRAFDVSLSNSFVAYATQRNDVINGFQKEKDKAINFIGSGDPNIDVSTSSFSTDLLEDMDFQFKQNLDGNINEMMNYNRGLADEKNNTSFELSNAMYAQKEQIEQKKLSEIQRGNAQIINGVLQMASTGLGIYSDNKNYKGTDENIENYKVFEKPESKKYETDYFDNSSMFQTTNRNKTHNTYMQTATNQFDRISELLRSGGKIK